MAESDTKSQPAPDDTYSLLTRYRAGDRTALATLVQRYYPRVEAIVRIRMGKDMLLRETVGDVVQDVFVRIVASAHQYERRGDAEWIDWIARLVQNEIADHVTRGQAQKRGGGAVPAALPVDTGSSPGGFVPAETTEVHAKAARAEESAMLRECCADLNGHHREVILLRDFAGHAWKVIAEKMGRSVEASQELHRRAHRELGRLMRRRGGA